MTKAGKAARTRQYIIAATAPLFNRKGYAGTSMADMVKATGLTKGSIYGNFRNKEEVAVEAFRYAMNQVYREVRLFVDQHTEPIDRLLALLDFYRNYAINPTVAGGCPLLNTATEADDNQPALKKIVRQEILVSTRYIRQLIEQAQQKQQLDPQIDREAWAYNLFAGIEGAIMMSRGMESMQPMRFICDHWQKLIKKHQL